MIEYMEARLWRQHQVRSEREADNQNKTLERLQVGDGAADLQKLHFGIPRSFDIGTNDQNTMYIGQLQAHLRLRPIPGEESAARFSKVGDRRLIWSGKVFTHKAHGAGWDLPREQVWGGCMI